MTKQAFDVRVPAIRQVSPLIKTFELVALEGGSLPPFSNDAAERHRYLISLLPEPAKIAGSQWMRDPIPCADILTAPR